MTPNQWMNDETARFVLAILVWITLNSMGFTILFVEPPSTMRDILIALIGSLSTIFVQQVQYYNKTGVNSDRQKDDTINKLTTASATLTAAANPAASEQTIPIKDGETKTIVGTGE